MSYTKFKVGDKVQVKDNVSCLSGAFVKRGAIGYIVDGAVFDCDTTITVAFPKEDWEYGGWGSSEYPKYPVDKYLFWYTQPKYFKKVEDILIGGE